MPREGAAPTRRRPAVEAIRRCGRTQASIANELGIRPNVLTQVLNGHKPSWPRLRNGLAELLDVDVAELFPEEAAR